MDTAYENFQECYEMDCATTNVAAHLAVIRDTTGDWKAKLPTAAGEECLGVTNDKGTTDGFHMSVIRAGRAECIADSAIAVGDRVQIAGTSGRIKTAQATLSTALTGANNDFVFTAVEKGKEGEEVSIEFIDPGTDTADASVDVQGTGIKVTLGYSSGAIDSLASEVKTALEASAAAMNLITVAYKTGNDGSGVVTALAETHLSGGGFDFGVAEEAATAQYDKIWVRVDNAKG